MKIRDIMRDFVDIIKQVVVAVGILVAIILLIRNYSIHQVSGDSMYPTFHDGDYILVKLNAEPDDMDVIVLTTSMIDNYKSNGQHIVKRYYEEYSTDGYFILGDNPEISYDSRYYGEVPREALEAVVVFDISKYFRRLQEAIWR